MNHVVYTAKAKQIRVLGTICKLCIEVLELFLFLFLYDAACLVCDVGYIYFSVNSITCLLSVFVFPSNMRTDVISYLI
jgi:hypothetical protein